MFKAGCFSLFKALLVFPKQGKLIPNLKNINQVADF